MIFENIKRTYRDMAHASMKAGRNPEDIRLLAVTKGVDPARIREAVDCGLREFGENRVQEAVRKIEDRTFYGLKEKIIWHLIGHLQKNKATIAVRLFDVIHSVDSVELADILNRSAEKNEKVQKVLVQIKLSNEESKHGIERDDLERHLDVISGMASLKVCGLMTIPPFFDDPEDARPYFRELREIRDREEARGFSLPELSMGMSHDFKVAIEEGATIVRVGTAIFGERNQGAR